MKTKGVGRGSQGLSFLDRRCILAREFRAEMDQWLYDGRDKSALDWDTRVRIVKGVGCGLSYMHSLPTPIIHCDIKASNVLLNGGFKPHIADFDLARRIESSHFHVSTSSQGVGYMPPEYKDGLIAATFKADVYNFGIPMVEIAMGQRPNPPVLDPGCGKEVGLIVWTKLVAQGREKDLDEGRVKEFFRPSSRSTKFRHSQRTERDEQFIYLFKLSPSFFPLSPTDSHFHRAFFGSPEGVLRKMNMESHFEQILWTEEQIYDRVSELATQVTQYFKDKDPSPVIIGVAMGAFLFVADLVRKIPLLLLFISSDLTHMAVGHNQLGTPQYPWI